MAFEQLNSNSTIASSTGPYFNFTGNHSETMDQTELPEWWKALWCAGFACIWPPAIILNLMVCWIILADKTMRKVTNYPLVNLAVADLLTSIFNTPFNFYSMLHNDWIWSELRCSINEFLSCTFITASVFTLMAISVDRCLVLTKAFASPQSKRVMYGTGLVIWTASFVSSSPILRYFDRFPVINSSKHICMWDNDFPSEKYYYNLWFMAVTYIIPLLVMGGCYTCICKKLWWADVIGDHQDSQRRMHDDRKRMVKMLIVVVTSFAVCWLPTHCYFIAIDYWPGLTHHELTPYFYLFFYWLAMSNNMMNPLIYFVVLPNFRTRFKQMLRSVGRSCQKGCAVVDRGQFTARETTQKKVLSTTGVTMETFAASDMSAQDTVDDP